MFGAFVRELFGDYRIMQIGAFDLSSYDLMIGTSLAACGWLSVIGRRIAVTVGSSLLLAIAGLALLNLLRGVPHHGIEALMALRATFPFVTYSLMGLLLAGAKFRYGDALQVFLKTAFVLSVLLFARSLLGPSYLYWGEYQNTYQINDGGRPLSANGTLLIGIGLLVMLPRLRRLSPTNFDLRVAAGSTFLFVALIISYQATAVVASLAAIATFIALDRGRARGFRAWAVVIGLISVAGLFAIADLLALLPKWIVGDVAQRAGNLGTRREVWDAFLDSFEGWPLANQLFGLPAGELPRFFVNTSGVTAEWQVSIHSMYFGTLPWTGVCGIVAYCTFLLWVFLRCIWGALQRRPSVLNPAVGAAFCVAVAIFGYSYEVRGEQNLLLALAIVASQQPRVFRRGMQAPLAVDNWSRHYPSIGR